MAIRFLIVLLADIAYFINSAAGMGTVWNIGGGKGIYLMES
jgi:hypothetical protein